MKKISRALFAASLALSTQLANADATYQYEIPMPSSYHTPLYPGLNLNELNKISIQVTRKDYTPEPVLDRVSLDFSSATDLVATNFSQDGNIYRALVNGAWVYKQVLVEVEAMGPISHNSNLQVRVSVVDQVSNLNQTGFSFGMETLSANGMLMDVTPNLLADKAVIMLEGKRLLLKLFRNPTDVYSPMYGGSYGFKVEADWLGHGVQSFAIPAPFGPIDADRFDAVALKIDSFPISPTEMEYNIAVEYTDPSGASTLTPFTSLRGELSRIFPNTAP